MSSTELPGARFGDWISEGWKMFTEQWKAWVLLALGYFAVMLVPTIGMFFVFFTMAFANAAVQTGPYGRSAPAAFPFFLVFVVTMLSLVVLLPLAAYIKGGMYKSAFKQLRGGQLEFRDLFSGGDCFLTLLGETILVGLVVFTGSMFCIVPGFIAAGLLMFAAPLAVERKMGVIDAMKASYEMTRQNILIFTLFALVLQLIVGAGTYLCYIGVLMTYPLMFTMSAVAYRDCFGLAGALSFKGIQAAGIPSYTTPGPYEPPPPQQSDMRTPPAPPAATFYTYEPTPPQAETTESPFPPFGTPSAYEPPEAQRETIQSPIPYEPPAPPESQRETIQSPVPFEPPAPPQPPTPQGTICPGCQTQLPATATFCFRCGTKVRG